MKSFKQKYEIKASVEKDGKNSLTAGKIATSIP